MKFLNQIGNYLYMVAIHGLLSIYGPLAYAQHPSEVQNQINQLIPKPIFKSPNAASIEKYGDHEVNLYTGLPDISVPLFEVKSGELSLPITLSYHAGGFRYTDQASWVGLGWSIIAGGQITRTIVGKNDENSFLTGTNNYDVNGSNCNDYFYKTLSINSEDREADMFSFTFPGKSGKFFLRQSGQAPYLFPHFPIRIIRDGNGLNYFDIIDENGVRYRFGSNSANVSAREFTTSQGSGVTTSGTTAWHLMEIHSPDTDDMISITYQSLGQQVTGDIEHNMTVSDQCNSSDHQNLPCPSLDLMVTEVLTSSTNTQLAIDEILFKSGKVKFVLGPKRLDLTGLNQLDRMEVYRKEGNSYTLVKSYQFNLSDYFKNAANTQNLRMKLKEIILRDSASTIINKYTFNYHTDNFSWDQATGSKSRDLFGFYNGKSNPNLIPVTTVQYQPNTATSPSNITIGGADRSTDTTFLKEAVLKRITYPTGGYTEFQFEPHRYLESGTVMYVGGLRIKRITSTTSDANLVKEYKYGSSESGNGHKNFNDNSYFFNMEQQVRNAILNPVSASRSYRTRMYFSNSAIGMGLEDSPVTYTTVTEYEAGSGTNGKTIYEFDNNSYIGDPYITVPYSTKTFKNSMAWARGKLTGKSVYNSNNNLVARTNITHSLFRSETTHVSQGVSQYIISEGWAGPWMLYCQSGSDVYDGFEYQVLNFPKTTGIYKETNREEIHYSPGLADYTKTFIKNYHATYLQLIHNEERASTNPQAVVTKYRYHFDIINPDDTYSGSPNVLKQMLLKNILHRPVEQYTLTQDTNGSNQKIIAGQVVLYRDIGLERYKPDKAFLLETATSLSPSSYVTVALNGTSALTLDTRYAMRINYDTYDSRGNILQFTKTGGQPSSVMWAYEEAYPVADALNTSNNNISYTSFEADEKGGWTYTGSPVVSSTSKTGRRHYDLETGNITKSGIGANSSNKYQLTFWARRSSGTGTWSFMGQTESLDTSWKLIEREVTGSSVTISGSSIFVDELRLHPEDAQMTTYTYDPLIGMTAMTDARNYTVTYEYDGMGRLKTVRDEDGNILEHYEYNFITGN